MSTPKQQVAQIIVEECNARNYSYDDTLAVGSTLTQESGLDDEIWGPNGKRITYGVAQQDGSYPNRMNGARAQIVGFLDKLDVWRKKPGASSVLWLNICWLQQAPNWPSAQYWIDHGRTAYLTEIQSRIGEFKPYLDNFWGTVAPDKQPDKQESKVVWKGDPTFIEDVLKPVLGSRLKVLPNYRDTGHGDFIEVRGVVWHHTGNSRETAQSIQNGRPDLDGPLSNLHIAPDGTVTLVALGVCWHAGQGSGFGIPTDNANWYMMGVECAWPDVNPDGSYDPAQKWPDAQFNSMLDVAAAIKMKLGPGTLNIGHKEWAGAAQGKWDPGNVDMNKFRGWIDERIAKIKAGTSTPDKPAPNPAPPPVNLPPDYAKETWDQLRIRWPFLGDRTAVETLGAIGEKLGVAGCYDTKKGINNAGT